MKTRIRVPLKRQIAQTDCALCCLTMIVSYYKSHVGFHELKERLGGGRDGVTLFALSNTASGIGFSANVLKADRISSITSPVIVYWDHFHYVVLDKINKKGYHVLDPAIGRCTYSEEEFLEHFSGYYLTLEPNENFKQVKPKSVWLPYLKITLEKPKLLFSILVWSLSIQLLTVSMPIITKIAIDEIAIPNHYEFLTVFFISIFGLVIFKGIISYLRGRFLTNLRLHLDWRLMSRFFRHLIHLPFQYFQLRSFGEIVYRANSHIMIRELFSQQTIMSVLDSTLVLIILGYMAMISPWLAGWVVVFGIVNILLLTFTQNALKQRAEEELSEQSKFQDVQVETLYGIFGIKMAGVEKQVLHQWEHLFKKVLYAFKKNEYFSNTINSYIVSLELAAPLIILGLSLHQVQLGNITTGSMVAFYSMTGIFFGLISSLVDTAKSMITMDTYLQRINDVLEAPVEKTPKNSIKPKELTGNIKLENVSFSYTQYSKPVLKHISVEIKAGQKVAIVGPSGSGKSTLARMLLGLYEPTAGKIFYDGINLFDLDKQWLRRNIGVVPQDATLFNKSILHNISVYDQNPSMDKVVTAAKIAQIHDEIMEMPMGYHTPVSEMSMNISGGQKQRIMLARALLQRPSILLLDEATSSLDNLNEKVIEQHLNELKCTRIVIAHRLSTIKDADLILVLKDGEIQEMGNHLQLIRNQGFYTELYNSNNDQAIVGGGLNSE
ncbi:peptidase domain-containing ABC transporter [Bacillus glycinifermentans]|uniref:Lantibiotic ABC transporter n=1 Tax=Bacillus glycinifermentans TaxID=1664069 RepID=A0A0T6BVB2_9BACI|nr:peptidase domain-containing ABC transporter [Bacillus glycinifermentans]ATH94123.1 lantibiotic ABC transporter [Bacillus glycinifermentans]KRT95554.1 lantibiotic ABC transporter [Bacillus glycinifermentans]MEC0484578.1 peptidase domain-containing ABC transporter [Bacillus glycinifermentans]